MDNIQIEKLIDVALNSIKHTWDKGDDCMPLAHVSAGAQQLMIPGDFRDEIHKDLFAFTVRFATAKFNAQMVIFYYEGWSKWLDDEEIRRVERDGYQKADVVPPSKSERRVEVFIWSVETRDGFSELRLYEIQRDKSGRKWVDREKFQSLGKGGKNVGRFANWFKKEM